MNLNQPSPSAHRTAHLHPLLLDIRQLMGRQKPRRLQAEFFFDPSFALSVTVSFVVEDGRRIVWVVGRDLLSQGLVTLSGIGDIQMWPAEPEAPRTARLQLNCGNSAALFGLPLAPLAAWLDATYQLVPAGTELQNVDWDAFAADLRESPEVPSD